MHPLLSKGKPNLLEHPVALVDEFSVEWDSFPT